MVKGRKVALMYYYSEDWIGGTYYIQNLIKALHQLEPANQPHLSIISSKPEDFEKLKEESKYTKLNYLSPLFNYTLLERVINKISRVVIKKNFIEHHHRLDFLFPFFGAYDNTLEKVKAKIFWIPDFQEHYLPEFFSEAEVKARKANQEWIVSKKRFVVFSSESAKSDFNKFYPGNKCRQFVMPFAVTHNFNSKNSINELLAFYNVPSSYFMCPNQFWKHKNHILILKALVDLKKRGKNAFVVFTGKEHDYRNPEYFDQLQEFTKENDLQENVKFLGFIEREHQLLLMQHANAIIQPSLFEGWSTVIEDAKALNKLVFASDLAVHQEQLGSKGLFFDVQDHLLVSTFMENYQDVDSVVKFNYEDSIKNFALDFCRLIDTACKNQSN